MAKVGIKPKALKETKWWEYVIRFVFGGIITVIAGILAKKYGPAFGGLFLAFPAILPASATLLEQHDGQKAAGVDCAGAVLGAVGLMAFGAVVWLLGARLSPWLVLPIALVVWFIVSAALWWTRQKMRHPSHGHAPTTVRSRSRAPG